MKTLITPLLILSLLVLLQGCSTNKVWVSETVASDVEANRDLVGCQDYARTGIDTSTKAPDKPKVYDTNCSGGGYGAVNCTTAERSPQNPAANAIGYALGKALANAVIMGKRKKNCMKNKGYQLVNKDSVLKQTVRQEDLDSWVGQPVSALEAHPLFSKISVTKKTTSDDVEIWNYKNGSKDGGCDNIFHVKDGVVLRYAPAGYMAGECFTDSSIQPQL